MKEEASFSEICEWICERESISIVTSKGELTSEGEKFVEILRTNPDKVLAVVKCNNHSQIRHFIIETNKSVYLTPTDYNKLCEEIVENLKKRFLLQRA